MCCMARFSEKLAQESQGGGFLNNFVIFLNKPGDPL